MTDIQCAHATGGQRRRRWSIRSADRLTAEFVEQLVLRAFDLPADTLRHGTRGRQRAARARQVAMYLLHVRLGLTLRATARAFGRDRTTAAHACRRIEELRENRRIDIRLDQLEFAIDHWRSFGPQAGRRTATGGTP